MFQIKSYLQYKNTPKPRVLKQGIHYDYAGGEAGEVQGLFDEIEGGLLCVAEFKDCQPLLTVEIDGIEWTEGDIVFKNNQYGFFYFNEEGANFMYVFKGYALSVFDLHPRYFDDFKKYNFFDNPTKYSKLLWDRDEKEGWDKVFKLLNI